MKRGRPDARKALLDGLFASLLGLALGIMGGTLLAERRGGAFATPEGLDRSTWNIVSPGLDQKVADPEVGRGTHVIGGALVIREHAFFRADVLVPADPRAVGRLVIALAPGSGDVRVVLRGSGAERPTFVRICDGGWSMGPTGQACTPSGAGPIELQIGEGRGLLVSEAGSTPIGMITPGPVELTTEGGEARITRLALYDTAGEPITEQDFAAAGPGRGVLWAGATLGGLLGAALAWALSRARGAADALAVLSWLAPPLLVIAPDGADWLQLTERLYFVEVAAWTLARGALALSLLPFAAQALLRVGLLRPRAGGGVGRVELAGWLALSAATTALGLRGLEAPHVWMGFFGLVFLLSPLRLLRSAGADARLALLQDLPAHGLIVGLGWGLGLLPAALYRGLCLLAGARSFAERGAGPATDQLALMGLLSIIGLEVGARSTFLDRAWDSARLSGDLAPTVAWRDPEPFWRDACGVTEGADGVIYVGGSSTGGAYQFVGEPDAFFPALVHRQLCGALPAGMGLRSTNFGDGGRDSFTIRRSLDKLLDRAPARLIVAYIGVNDLLGSNNTRTRKEREADLDRRSEAASHLAGWGARSRIITGVGLLLHPPQDLDRPPVADVPLPDAEENLRLIAAEAARRGARLLLLTELVSGELTSQLAPYAALEARLAAELDGVEYFDLRGAIGDVPDSELLVDRNHLSRAGSARVAAALAPIVVAELSRPVVGAP